MEFWISKLLGPIMLVLAIPMMFMPNSLNEITERFLEDKPLVLISGVLAMAAGLSIVNSYNVWRLDWTLIITFFGWALVIGGALRIMMPNIVPNIGRRMTGNSKVTVMAGFFWAMLGGFLSYKGYR